MIYVGATLLMTGTALTAGTLAAASYTQAAPSRPQVLSTQAAPAFAAVAGQTPRAQPTLTQAPGELTITARDQPIASFLRDLFGRAGRPVVPSAGLTGTVNGLFRGSVNKIYADIARAFNLVSYDDGAALYVYAASELRVVTLQVGQAAAQRAQRLATSQGLTDRRNYVRMASDGNLVVSGTPRFVEQVSALAQGGSDNAPGSSGGGSGGLPGYGGALGAAPPPQPLEFRVFYLRYARAEDTTTVAGGRELRLPGIATILQNLVLDQRPGGSALSTPAPTLGARLLRQSQPRLKGTGLDAIVPGIEQTPTYGQPAPGILPGETLGIGGGGADIVAPLTADIVRIEPNPYLNAIIVRDVPERMAAYDSLIRALDVEPQVVEVEATIIDINVDRLRKLGVNWRFGSGGLGFLFGDGTANDLRLNPIPGSSRRDNTTNIVPQNNGFIPDLNSQGGTLSTIIGSDREFLGRIQALETKGAARVVTRPQVMTLSNVEAVFDRTRTFYVRVGGIAQVDLFNVTAGTILRVNPHVFRDHDQTRIRMLVNIEDGSISPTSMVENIPVVERSSVATQAMVTDGESLLLGGMTVDADYENLYKIPLLGDIPVLGNLFKSRQRNKQRIERLFLITPRLVSLGSRVGPTTLRSNTMIRPTPIQPGPGVGTTPAVPAAPAPAPQPGGTKR